MKNFFYICLALLFATLCFSACKRDYDPRLVRIDRLLADGILDTAQIRQAFDSIAPEVEDMSERDRMFHALLQTEFQNKQYLPFTSDSLIRKAAEYYEHNGTPNEQMRAYFLLGSVYRDLNSSIISKPAYHKITTMTDTTEKESDDLMQKQLYKQLDLLYQGPTKDELFGEIYNNVQKYRRQSKDSLFWSPAGFSQVDYLRDMQLWDSILVVNQQFYKDLIAAKDKEHADNTWMQAVNKYMILKNSNIVAHYLPLNGLNSEQVENYYKTLPEIIRENYDIYKYVRSSTKGELDSAFIFYPKELNTDLDVHVEEAPEDLSNTYKRQGNSNSTNHSKLYTIYKKHSNSLNTATLLRELQVHFDLNRERQYTETYKALSTQWEIMLYITAFIFIVCLIIWRLHRKKILQKKQSLEDTHNRLREEYDKKKRHLEQLQSESLTKQALIEKLKMEMEDLRKDMEEQSHQSSSPASQDNDMEQIHASVIDDIRKIAKARKGLTENDVLWMRLKEHAMNTSCRLKKLLESTNISEKEQRITLLVWAGLSPIEIATLIITSKQNISTTRSRLHEKLFGCQGNTKDFDKRIREIDQS